MDDLNELFNVVDAEDRVLGQATRGEVHAKELLHRSVHILVFDFEGRLFLQERSAAKDENPGFWDTSAAGHVNAGETYLDCAHRELMEELGLQVNLEPVMKITACPETFWEHVAVFSCQTDAPITINPDEIKQGRFWTLDEIQKAVRQGDLPFTSSFKLILHKYLNRSA
ncbi:MAG: NUDIX domain-containing protein [Nitrospinaceae bacterium]